MQIHVVDSFLGLLKIRLVAVFQENLSGTEYLGRPDNWKISGPGSGSGPGPEIAAAQRAAAADGPGPDLDPGPGPEIFQLSGRPRYSVPDKFSWWLINNTC